ncbi:hypothetical protein OAI66_05880 [Gammaproteobacteria bacterium]|nr:hypothetical protein [Gammaproteobacteria bacterium]
MAAISMVLVELSCAVTMEDSSASIPDAFDAIFAVFTPILSAFWIILL